MPARTWWYNLTVLLLTLTILGVLMSLALISVGYLLGVGMALAGLH